MEMNPEADSIRPLQPSPDARQDLVSPLRHWRRPRAAAARRSGRGRSAPSVLSQRSAGGQRLQPSAQSSTSAAVCGRPQLSQAAGGAACAAAAGARAESSSRARAMDRGTRVSATSVVLRRRAMGNRCRRVDRASTRPCGFPAIGVESLFSACMGGCLEPGAGGRQAEREHRLRSSQAGASRVADRTCLPARSLLATGQRIAVAPSGCSRYADAALAMRGLSVAAGSLPPNPWGLHEMHGNVSEWCADWCAPYSTGEEIDPRGPRTGVGRALRGSSWIGLGRDVPSASRSRGEPGGRLDTFVFRLALGQQEPAHRLDDWPDGAGRITARQDLFRPSPRERLRPCRPAGSAFARAAKCRVA